MHDGDRDDRHRRRDDPSGDGAPRHHRPVPRADLTDLIDAAGGSAPISRAELAAATAEVVVRAGRGGASNDGDSGARFVGLADRVGLDTLAELWRDADPVSLPGALWALYLLRQWSQLDADEVTRLWRLGEPYAPADAVVAGVADLADASAVRDLADAVLAGAYQGDFAVALERAAAFFRVVAAGRRCVAESFGSAADPIAGSAADSAAAPDGSGVRRDADVAIDLAERNERAATALAAAAARWRAGTLR